MCMGITGCIYVRDCTITTMLSQQALDYWHWYAQYLTIIDIYTDKWFMLHVRIYTDIHVLYGQTRS